MVLKNCLSEFYKTKQTKKKHSDILPMSYKCTWGIRERPMGFRNMVENLVYNIILLLNNILCMYCLSGFLCFL